MAVAYVQEFDIVDGDTSTTNYDSIAEKLGNEPGVPGLIVHTAGFDHDAGVFRILDVWESADDLKRFREERLGPVVGELMASNPGAALLSERPRTNCIRIELTTSQSGR
jgi:hypothetical protein